MTSVVGLKKSSVVSETNQIVGAARAITATIQTGSDANRHCNSSEPRSIAIAGSNSNVSGNSASDSYSSSAGRSDGVSSSVIGNAAGRISYGCSPSATLTTANPIIATPGKVSITRPTSTGPRCCDRR
jgi:hypothetical protein